MTPSTLPPDSITAHTYFEQTTMVASSTLPADAMPAAACCGALGPKRCRKGAKTNCFTGAACHKPCQGAACRGLALVATKAPFPLSSHLPSCSLPCLAYALPPVPSHPTGYPTQPRIQATLIRNHCDYRRRLSGAVGGRPSHHAHVHEFSCSRLR
jgi:hypothetical protein